ncbi:MAG: hypothetical protein HQ553_11475 [Chloroflexi bacterium]|nr:hypothetical protein [Chloroflexota bacterium]
MNRSRMLNFLDEIDINDGSVVCLYFPPGLPASEIEGMLIRASKIGDVPPELNEIISESHTGCALIWGNQYRCLVRTPFPIEEKRVSDGYDLQPLRSLLNREFSIALIIVRLGDYAIGVFEGEKRISSKAGTGLVHSRHKKGGSSQRRFERHREKQIESFFTRVCGRVREQLEQYPGELDYLIYGGDSNTLRSFRRQCKSLATFDDRTLKKRLNVRKPRQKSLEAAIADVWSSDLIEWFESK